MTPWNKSGWSREFEKSIIIQLRGLRGKSRELATLKDAGEYIAKLPKAEHTATEWQTAAMKALLLAVARRADYVGTDRHLDGAAPP